MNFTARVISHEIGQSWGLRLSLRFEGHGQSYSLSGGVLRGAMTMLEVNAGEIPLKEFRPVHKQAVQNHFL